MMGERPACLNCKHFISIKGAICKAFPEGIPDAIYVGGYDHTKPFFGDQGITFEPITSKEKIYQK